MTKHHTRVRLYKFHEDGTVELPEGAIIISLEFGDMSYGYENRPSAAWVQVPADAT